VWGREDDMRAGWYRPMYYHTLNAGLDAQGNLVAWKHVIVGQSILTGTAFESMMVKDGVDATSVEGAANLPYAIPNLAVALHSPKIGVPVQWWRSVGSTHTAFATECFLDEIARETKKDPYELRRALLVKHPRHKGVLELAAQKAGWGKPLPAGRARGIAGLFRGTRPTVRFEFGVSGMAWRERGNRREFLARNGEFTVNIALIETGTPALGVVHAPALNATYWGSRHGVFAATDGAPARPIQCRKAPAKGLVALMSRHHATPEAEAYIAKYPIANRITVGSSLKFCRVAEGKADIYPRFGHTMEWDTAAGHAVLTFAGGSVVDLEDHDLRYGKPGFDNPPFIAKGANLPDPKG